jgi:hypothetical protein
MKYQSLLAVVGVTLVLSAPLLYASYLVYKKQQTLLRVLGRRSRRQRDKKPIVRVPAEVPMAVPSPSSDGHWDDDEEHHDVGLDLDSIPMFTPRTALL